MYHIKVINRSEIRNGWKGTLTLLSVFYFLLWSDLKLWFETTSAHHNAARIETRTKWSTQTAALSSLKSLRFSPSPLKSDARTHYQNTGLSPLCWAPAERKPRSYVGFWVACVYFRGIMVQLWNKEGGTNLISLQCHTDSHVFHTLGHLLPPSLPPWHHQPVQTFSVPLLHPKCDLLPWRDIFVNIFVWAVSNF